MKRKYKKLLNNFKVLDAEEVERLLREDEQKEAQKKMEREKKLNQGSGP